jgi:hypothetical protein
MRFSQWLCTSVLMAGVFLCGCDKAADTKPATGDTKPAAKKDDHGHDHDDDHDHGPGPHKGTILEFGKYHGEFVVDHDTKEATVYILSGNLKKAAPIDVDKLLLSIDKPKFQVDLLPKPMEGEAKGSSSRFVAKHDNFGVKQEFSGTVSGEIQGKGVAGDFKEKP